MEVVRDFNNELSSLYEVKPPISKAKMMQITKCAIKGIKFYKHIVQSVEKFIQKCRPEYKIPGLYVIDSIVRQSRHQFGPDKEVFGPRFVKNIVITFQHLFNCENEDKAKVVRVLNLWQKNGVFNSDVIQPLLDMANPNSTAPESSQPQPPIESTNNSKHKSSESWKGWPQQNTEEQLPPEPHTYSEMSMKNVEKFTKANSSGLPETVMAVNKNSEIKPVEDNTVKFNKKLLDFDYGDEEDEEENKPDESQQSLAYSISQNLLSNPELLRQLQQMQQTIQQNELKSSAEHISLQQSQQSSLQPILPKENADHFSPAIPDCKIPGNLYMESQPPSMSQQQTLVQPPQPSMMYPYDGNTMGYPPLPPHMPLMQEQKLPPQMDATYPMMPQENLIMPSSHIDEDDRMMYSMPGEPPLPPTDLDERSLVIPGEDRLKKERSRSRSGSRGRGRSGRHRSRSRSPRRRKSRSRSRSRSRRNRSRSRDRDRERRKEREREKDRERDRARKGIPPIKKNFISVCSTTLWLGHVPKTLSEEDIASTFADYGPVSSIDMIPPRGCAYVVMERRQDAHRALTKLKNLKLQGSTIKMAWAPGKGTKGKEFKDNWEVELGVSYIPFEKIKDINVLDALGEGGFIDEESLPPHLREMRQQRENAKLSAPEVHPSSISTVDKSIEKNGIISQPPPTLPPAMLPANLSSLPYVLPQMMQPQLGMPLPGLLPPQSMVVPHMQMPVGVPPPNPLMMVQPPTQGILPGTPLPVGAVPQLSHLPIPHPSVTMPMTHLASAIPPTEQAKDNTLTASDATPTDEDGTRVQSPANSLTTSSVNSVSVSITTQGSINHFNSTVHSDPRQLVAGLPVSTSNSLPFPPPQMGFGYPPPSLRPGVPPQGMSVAATINSGFPWQKLPAPVYSGFSDADMRFNSGQVGKPVNLPQPSAGNDSGSVPVSREQSDKESLQRADSRNSETYGGRGPPNMYKRPGSPSSYDESNMDIDHPEGLPPPPEMFPGGRDEYLRPELMGGGPRFMGHQEFHPHGGMRGRWIPPPGNMPNAPRFLRPGMHGAPQFVPRGGGPRGAFPRMEMDYYPPGGPRMMSPNIRGHPPRRGAVNFPPPRGAPDHFGNRDFYSEPPRFEEEERSRPHDAGKRNDWNQVSRHEEDQNRRNEDENKKSNQFSHDKEKSHDVSAPREETQKISDNSVKLETKPKPVTLAAAEIVISNKPKAKKQAGNLMFDMMRLTNYAQKKGVRKPLNKNKDVKKAALIKEKLDKPADVAEKESKKSNKVEETSNIETQDDTKTNVTKPIVTVKEIVPEATAVRRERDRKRSSRWGRTLSEEREFQLQKNNETNVNGGSTDPLIIHITPVSNVVSLEENISDPVHLKTIDETVVKTINETVFKIVDETVFEAADKVDVKSSDETFVKAIAETTINTVDEMTVNTVGETTVNTVGETTVNTVGETTVNTIGETTVNIVGETNVNTVGETNVNTVGETTIDTVDEMAVDTIDETTVNIFNEMTVNTIGETSLNTIDETTFNTIDETTLNTINETTLNTIDEENVKTMEETNVEQTDNNLNMYQPLKSQDSPVTNSSSVDIVENITMASLN